MMDFQAADPGHHLKCPKCSGLEFIRAVKIRVMAKGGTAEEPSAMWCLKCMEPADNATMHRNYKIQEKKWQMREILNT